MGDQFCFTCEHCHHEYAAHIGRGFGYDEIYRARIAAIKAGAYGPARQEALNKTPGAVINADYVLYICNSCKAWEVSTDISLYAPNRPEDMPSKSNEKKTPIKARAVQLFRYIQKKQYFFEQYHLMRRYYHRCSRCGKRMHKASQDEMVALPCPKCGRINQVRESRMWD